MYLVIAGASANQAEALYAYDFPGKYTVPGTITHCPECNRQRALEGVRVPVRPHLGTAGVAPDVKGRVSTIPPGTHGGNIDNWRIGAGATMYYPVAVDGALFSIGDPHISQGDGELSVDSALIRLTESHNCPGHAYKSRDERGWVGAEIEQRPSRQLRVIKPVRWGQPFAVFCEDRANVTQHPILK